MKLIPLLFCLLLAGCAASEPIIQTETIQVPVRVYVPIPDELTEPCPGPKLPEGDITYGDVIEYAMDQNVARVFCNKKLGEIRTIQGKILDEQSSAPSK